MTMNNRQLQIGELHNMMKNREREIEEEMNMPTFMTEEEEAALKAEFGNEFELQSTGALKDTAGKSRIDLVPAESIEALGDVLAYGASKYEDHNWEKGIPFSKTYAAAMRHLLKWHKGIDLDDESGLHHMEHAFTNIMMIVTQIRRDRTDLDDRYVD